MLEEMQFRIEVRRPINVTAADVQNSNADGAEYQSWQDKLSKEITSQPSEADRKFVIKNALTERFAQGVRDNLDRRPADEQSSASRVMLHKSMMRTDADFLLLTQIYRLRNSYPDFEGISQKSLEIIAHPGVPPETGGGSDALEKDQTSTIQRVMKSLGLRKEPESDVAKPYLALEAKFRMKGDEQTLDAVVSELRQAFQSLGVIHHFEARLVPARPLLNVAPLEGWLAARTHLPPVGAEAIGLISSVAQSLRAGDTAGAFDAAEAFVDLARRSPALNKVLEGTEQTHMAERFGGVGGDAASKMTHIIADLRANSDAQALETLFFEQHPDHRGIMPLLRQITDDRRADTRSSRRISAAFEIAFGQPENMLMHLITFDRPEHDGLHPGRVDQSPASPAPPL